MYENPDSALQILQGMEIPVEEEGSEAPEETAAAETTADAE